MNRNILLTTTHLTAPAYNNGDQGTTMTLPTGRIVWGHPGKPKPATDQKGNPKLGKDGQQMMETSFGLAIPTDVFNAQVWPAMHAEMSKGYPSGAPGNFSWKITQENEIDNNGKPYAEREGYRGHTVLAVSTTLEPPGIFQHDGSKWVQMQPEAVKCGDFVKAEINFKVNVPTDRTHTPSLYVNPRAIGFAGYGEAIQTGFQANPEQAFGNGPPPLPTGASATPVGAGAGAPGMPSAPAAAPAPNAPAAPSTGVPAPQPTTAPSPVAAPAPAPAEPQRPTEPSHVHDNGDGTEQWLVNGQWDGQRHPVQQAAPAPAAPAPAPAAPAPAPAAPAAPGGTLPPPATGFVADAAGGAPAAPTMPGAPPPR